MNIATVAKTLMALPLIAMLALAGCGGGGGGNGPMKMDGLGQRPVTLPEGHGLAAWLASGASGDFTVAAGEHRDAGGVRFSCPPGGDDCQVSVRLADGAVMVTSTGGMATASLATPPPQQPPVQPRPVNCPDGSTVPAGQSCPVQPPVAPSSAIEEQLRLYRAGNPSLGMTAAQVKTAVTAVLTAATHNVDVANNHDYDEIVEPHRTTFPLTIPAGLDFGSFTPVMRHNGVSVFARVQATEDTRVPRTAPAVPPGGEQPPPPQPQLFTDRTLSLGGWMDRSYFEVELSEECVGSCSLPVFRHSVTSSFNDQSGTSWTRPSGTNPVGPATWTGVMVGLSSPYSNSGRGLFYTGAARIALDSSSVPTVDISFTDIHDLDGNSHADLSLNDIPVRDGKFGVDPAVLDDVPRLGAAFAGPNHEEVVGMFESLGYIERGAFGAKRQ